jgi:hypothetical protein
MSHNEEKKQQIQKLLKENLISKSEVNHKQENPVVHFNGTVHFSSRDINITYVCKKDDSCDKK